jgi:hypothetical protein
MAISVWLVQMFDVDVLLARLEGEDVPDPAVHVHSLADDAPGHPPNVVQAGGDDAQVRAPEVQVVAEDLTLGHGDVGAQLSRRGQHAERERVEHLDGPGAAGVGLAEQLACRFEDPKAVGMLDDHGGHVVADMRLAPPPLLHGEDLGLVARSPAVGPKGLEIPGIDRLRDQDPVPARRRPGQVHRLS